MSSLGVARLLLHRIISNTQSLKHRKLANIEVKWPLGEEIPLQISYAEEV